MKNLIVSYYTRIDRCVKICKIACCEWEENIELVKKIQETIILCRGVQEILKNNKPDLGLDILEKQIELILAFERKLEEDLHIVQKPGDVVRCGNCHTVYLDRAISFGWIRSWTFDGSKRIGKYASGCVKCTKQLIEERKCAKCNTCAKFKEELEEKFNCNENICKSCEQAELRELQKAKQRLGNMFYFYFFYLKIFDQTMLYVIIIMIFLVS